MAIFALLWGVVGVGLAALALPRLIRGDGRASAAAVVAFGLALALAAVLWLSF